jgi:transposase
MIQIEFTEEEIGQLHHERLGHPHSKVRQRCEVVYLKALGFTHKEIGRIIRLSQPTVRSYLEMYRTGGLEKLKELSFYQPTSELDAHRDGIRTEFETRPPKSIAEAVKRIEDLTGIRRSPTQVREFLKSLGMKRLKAGQVPAKADPEKQKTFLEDELEPRLEEAKQGKRHMFPSPMADPAAAAMTPKRLPKLSLCPVSMLLAFGCENW